MFPIDDSGKLDYELRKLLSRQLGRIPTEEDVAEHYRQQATDHSEWEAERQEQERLKIKEQALKERERQIVLDARHQSRNVAPPEPLRHLSADELDNRALSNLANCEQAKLLGEESSRVVINSDLEAFNFNGATFRNVIFSQHAKLNDASFVNAIFENVEFQSGCEVNNTDFSRARFKSVTFQRCCQIDGASFQLARFGKAVQIEFDQNNISGAAFLASRTDKWFQLSKAYSPIAQTVNALLSMTYFGIILLKLYIFKSLTVLQEVSGLGMSDRMAGDFHELSVLRFLFGSEWTTLALAVLIIVYQALRLAITVRIAPLIEAERQSGHTPPLEYFETLMRLQALVRVLGFVALSVFVYELYGLFNQDPLLIPNMIKQI